MGYLSIDFGSRMIRLLEAEGTAKKLKLKAFRMIDTHREGSEMLEDSAGSKQAAETIKRTISKHKFSRDPSSMALDSSQCVVRELSLPFKGDDQIRKVIKFETESHIQDDIDDVVVSYFRKSETIDKSNLMVMAARKKTLQKHLDFLDGLNIDPLFVDLDILCLYNALSGTGILKEHGCFVVINVARDHTDLLVIDKERLISCRSIPLGAGNIAAALQHELSQEKLDPSDSGIRLLGFTDDRSLTVSAFEGREAAAPPPAAGAVEVEKAEEDSEAGEDSEPKAEEETEDSQETAEAAEPESGPEAKADQAIPAPAAADDQDTSQMEEMSQKWRQDFLQKLRREVVRVLSLLEMENAPEKVYLTGMGSPMPGLAETAKGLFHAEAEELDFLSRVDHSFPENEARAVNHEVGVALGVAFKQVGHDATRVNLRQEEVKYAKKFDQVKVPLTCLTFLLLIMMVLLNLKLLKERQCQQDDMNLIYRFALRELGTALESMDEAQDRVSSKKPFTREGVAEVLRQLKAENTRLLDDLGRGGTIPELPSIFPVWTAFFDALDRSKDALELFKLDSLKIVTTPTPQMTIDGEVASGADMSKLKNILEGIPIVTKVEVGDSTPTPEGNRKFSNTRVFVNLEPGKEAE